MQLTTSELIMVDCIRIMRTLFAIEDHVKLFCTFFKTFPDYLLELLRSFNSSK